MVNTVTVPVSRRLRAGAQIVRFTAPGEHTATPVSLGPDTVHTVVVLDDGSGLRADAVTDAAGLVRLRRQA